MMMLLAMDKIIRNVKNILSDDKSGLTYNELLLLISLREEGKTLRDISQYLLMDKGQTSKLSSSLLTKKYIYKIKKVGYPKEYYLSHLGKDILKDVYNTKEFIIMNDFKNITKTEMDTTREVLKKQEEILTSIYGVKK